MNKKGQLFHWAVFVILIMLLILFSLKPVEKKHFRGEIVSKVLSTSKEAELDYIYNREYAKIALRESILDTASKAGSYSQECGKYKNMSVVREDCLPDYETSIKESLRSKTGGDIFLVSTNPLTIIMDRGDIVKNIELSAVNINVPQSTNFEAVKTIPNVEYSTKYRLTGLKRRGKRVDRIILHHTGDRSAGQTYRGLKGRGLSVHYILDKDGTLYYVVDESLRAAHAYRFNDRSIGIEIVNLGTKSDNFTAAQYKTLNLLLRDIAKRWPDIDYDTEHIMGHFQTSKIVCDNKIKYSVRSNAPCGKYDPSPNFEWDRLGLKGHITLADLGLRAPKEAGFA